MKTALVGYTGFVGSNIKESYNFTDLYNSKNINDITSEQYDLVVYSGVTGTKYLANLYPEEDRKHIEDTILNLKNITTKKLVLISTVDVYPNPVGYDELYNIDSTYNHTYGKNRLYLEKWVKENIKDYSIIRIPALYGKNLKKNFIYDIINIIPPMIKEEQFQQFINDEFICSIYKYDNNFYKLNTQNKKILKQARELFLQHEFNALKFTDSRNMYQFYNLKNLWKDICKAVDKDIKIINIVSAPIKASELYYSIFKKEYINIIQDNPTIYDLKTIYSNNQTGYLYDKQNTMSDLITYINESIKHNYEVNEDE